MSSLVTDENRISDGSATSISGAAEELFKSLGGGGPHQHPGSSNQPALEARHKVEPNDGHRSRGFGQFVEEPSIMSPQTSALTWRDTLSTEVYQTLVAKYDVFEMRRQEVIWELCRSEEEFVDLLQTMLDLFVRPLRTENDTKWIPGLDPSVAKLFDWLDDIAQLHVDVLIIMQGCRTNQVRPTVFS